jgi:hypothetical protein
MEQVDYSMRSSELHAIGSSEQQEIQNMIIKQEEPSSSASAAASHTPPAPHVGSVGRGRGAGRGGRPKKVSSDLCQVCGDYAAGFHCGAFVCEPCKVG